MIKQQDLNEEQTIKTIIPKFSHNSKIVIIVGFYKGYTGLIKGYKAINNKIEYQIELREMDNQEYWIREDEIRIKPKILGLF